MFYELSSKTEDFKFSTGFKPAQLITFITFNFSLYTYIATLLHCIPVVLIAIKQFAPRMRKIIKKVSKCPFNW